jgi:hypothetical protein
VARKEPTDTTTAGKPGKTAGQAKGSGRATPKAAPGRAEKPGRYTPPIPRQVRQSPKWFPYTILGLMGLGVLAIVLDYIDILPGGTNTWYLIGGIVAIVSGLIMATFYH